MENGKHFQIIYVFEIHTTVLISYHQAAEMDLDLAILVSLWQHCVKNLVEFIII